MRRSIFVLLLTALLGAGAAPSVAQEPSREEALARELLEVTGAGEMWLQVAEQMVQGFAASNPEVPQEFWDAFVAEVDAGELDELVVPIYVEHLTAEEMEAALDFYRTEVGQSLLRKMPAVMSESMRAGEQWGMEVAQRVMEKLEARGAPPEEP